MPLCASALIVVALLASADEQPKPPPFKASPANIDNAAEAKEDLKKVQGTWSADVRDPRTGKPLGRIVKYIKGNKEMVVQESADGKIVEAHRVDFEVNRLGAVRLFTYYNAEITEGPQKGQTMPPYTYIYKVDEQFFTEVMGMLAGQEKQAPSARVYKRVENAEAESKGHERQDAKKED